MAMLVRIKKKQWEGFKDFVESMEVTPALQRSAILLNGILEDPRFMRWVTRNLHSFKDFMNLPTDNIEAVLKSNESIISIFAKALEDKSQAELQRLMQGLPRFASRLKDEIDMMGKELTPNERESAQFFLLKTIRKMQRQELVTGFHWELPPPEIFYDPPAPKDGLMEITFEDGRVAAAGEMLKGKRIGVWKHYYDDGRLLGEGTYVEGTKNGKWCFYYGQGTPRAEGKFIADARQGTWREWDRDGQEKTTEWTDGKRTS